eukprot:354579-Chlamydomonas_euryale.AAC.1
MPCSASPRLRQPSVPCLLRRSPPLAAAVLRACAVAGKAGAEVCAIHQCVSFRRLCDTGRGIICNKRTRIHPQASHLRYRPRFVTGWMRQYCLDEAVQIYARMCAQRPGVQGAVKTVRSSGCCENSQEFRVLRKQSGVQGAVKTVGSSGCCENSREFRVL